MARSLYDQIRDIVLQETMYLRIYSAKVVDIDDPQSRGRIQVRVLDLTWGQEGDNNAEFIDWAVPRNVNGLLTPKVGDSVDVYFVGGRKENLAYLGTNHEVESNRPTSYEENTDQVIFESRAVEGKSIVYDEAEEILKLIGDAESYVKGDTFKTELDKIIALLGQVKTSLTSFVPTGTPADAATWASVVTTPLTPLQNGSSSDILSEEIKGV